MSDGRAERAPSKYLTDEKFITWMLCPTDELDTYWQRYTEENPEEEVELSKAKALFRKVKLSSYKLDEATKEKAIARLEKALLLYQRKRKVRRMLIMTLSTAAAILLLIFFQQDMFRQSDPFSGRPIDYYVGSELESKDIQLFTGDRTTSFEENIDVTISNDQRIEVKKENSSEEDEIIIDRNTINRLVVPHGKRSKVMLSDGTQIWLNAGSTLIFPTVFNEKTREVKLRGEMYAEVTHDPDRPFIVKTDQLDLKVYGTDFNLSAYEDAAPWVVLVEGSVGVKAAGGKEMKLAPNERIVRNRNGLLEKSKVDVSSFVSWKDGYLAYEKTPIAEVLKQIERYYNLSFNLDDQVSLQGVSCSGKIILTDNLDNVLTALTLISNTRYHRENKSIYIYE